MATNLTTIFGSAIIVTEQPLEFQKQYAAYPGAAGLTAMNLGSRGRPLAVRGRLAATGVNYSVARANLQAIIDAIEAHLDDDATDYEFAGVQYPNVVWSKLYIIPGNNGKTFHYTADGYLVCNFVCTGRELI